MLAPIYHRKNAWSRLGVFEASVREVLAAPWLKAVNFSASIPSNRTTGHLLGQADRTLGSQKASRAAVTVRRSAAGS